MSGEVMNLSGLAVVCLKLCCTLVELVPHIPIALAGDPYQPILMKSVNCSR